MNLQNTIISLSQNPIFNITIGFVGALLAAFLGAYFNSKFEWLGYRKQKIAEIIITTTKDIHSNTNEVSFKIAELYVYLQEYLRVNESNKDEALNGKNIYVIPKAFSISSDLTKIATSFNYMNYFHKFNTDIIVSLNNNWANYAEFLQANSEIDKAKITEITDFMHDMNDELNKLNKEILNNTLKVI